MTSECTKSGERWHRRDKTGDSPASGAVDAINESPMILFDWGKAIEF